MKRDKTKSPWRWLITGDKGLFMILWLILTGVAIYVSAEYGLRTVLVTAVCFGTIFGILCIYRIGRYYMAVEDMEILSFSAWRRLR